MLSSKKSPYFLLIGFILFASCTANGTPPVTNVTETPNSLPAATATLLPTPSSPSDSIQWDNLQVTLDQLEITGEYLTDYGSTRVPPAEQKFLWVHIRLKNTGQVEIDTPLPEHYSILYAAIELKPTYGHRQNHTDYTTLGSTIFPDQELGGWLRFDIPATAELRELRFVFLPESAQVGTSYTSPNYPYADNKPTYVWDCAP